MTDQFPAFAKAVHDRYEVMSANELFVVDVPDLFATYLAAFPEGANPIFRTNTEHDCSCCKNFVRNLGKLVSIDASGNALTVWDDFPDTVEPYGTVARTLAGIVRQAPILHVYRTKEHQYGAEQTRELLDDNTTRTWKHFHGRVATKHFSTTPDTARGDKDAVAQILRRGLEELRYADMEAVIDLIDAKALYRGEEHRASIVAFQALARAYEASLAKDTFIWANLDNRNARFRNTVIGTLLVDLADGKDLEQAVKAFETKVAPTNYKRPTALITPKMIDQALDTLKALDLESAVERRFARIADVSVNNVLFVDNAVQPAMKDGLRGTLMQAADRATNIDVTKAQPIRIEDFFETVVPKTTSMAVLLENSHLSNFVSLTAPQEASTGKLFKWDNDFAWSYDGEVTDSIKERVKAAGGNVNAKLRVSLAWFNLDDLDIHAHCPDGHVHYARKQGILDVDMNAFGAMSRQAVENLSWTSPRDGAYRIMVNQYSKRENIDLGFTLQLATAGRVEEYSYKRGATGNIPCLEFDIVKGELVNLKVGDGLVGGSVAVDKWSVSTNSLVPIDTVMLSPNHWDGQGVGNKHWFFMLKGCKNPDPVRGIYNEFLRPSLEPHRKVFEVLGAKTKCPPTDDQLSGVGFSSTRGDKVVIVANNKPYAVQF